MEDDRAMAQHLADKADELRKAGREDAAQAMAELALTFWRDPEPAPGATGEEPEQVRLREHHERMKAELEAGGG